LKTLEKQIAETPVLAFTPFLSDLASASGDAEAAGDTISSAKAFPQISLSGLVEAILEVGNQRKAHLSRLRLALRSGSDSEALGFARQLCGLRA